MSDPPPAKLRTYYALIPHPTAPWLLLLPTATGWAPPQIQSAEPNLFAGGPLDRWVQEQWGLIVTQLQVITMHLDPADQRWDWALIALENHSPAGTLPTGAHWVGRADLAAHPLAYPPLEPTITAWLTELETGVLPPARAAWARRGWWAEINAWVADTLAAQRRPLVGPLEQRKLWGISCLLRGQTTGGPVYVKACPTLPLFTNEAVMTAELAARYPGHIPMPLAVEPDRRWMVLADFGGDLLQDAPRSAWDSTVDVLATLQKSSVSEVESLLGVGCLDRRLARLEATLPTLWEGVERYGGLDATQLRAFAALLPRLATACGELAEAAVPPTLVHGDLHDGNIAVIAGQPLFFDWSDACIAHPFFDLSTLLDTPYFASYPTEGARVRDRYLGHWTAYAPLPELRRIADLANWLGHLHQVVSYVGIVSNLEPTAKGEHTANLDSFVRALLDGANPASR